MARMLVSLGLAFSMLGGLALAQSTSSGTPTGSQGTNTSPATEGTLNGNHGSSAMSQDENSSPAPSGSTEGTDNSTRGDNAMGSGASHINGTPTNGSTSGTISGSSNTSNDSGILEVRFKAPAHLLRRSPR